MSAPAPKSTMVRGQSGRALLLANIVYQAVVLLSMVPLVRFYSPSEFGRFGVSAATIQLIGLVSALRLDMAIPLPRSNRRADTIYFSGLAVVCATMLATACATFAAQRAGLKMPFAVWEITLGVGLSGLQQSCLQRALRYHQFNLAATGLVMQAAVMALVQLACGVAGATENGLVYGFIAGLASTDLIYLAGQRKLRWPGRGWRRLFLNTITKDIHLSIYNVGATLMASLGTALPLIIFNSFFSSAATGLYLAASRIVSGPIDFVGKGVSQYLVGHVSAATRQDDDARHLVETVFRQLTLASVVPISLVAVSAPWSVPFILGPEWSGAIPFVQLLCFGGILQFIVAPLTALFNVFGQQKRIFVLLLGLLVARILGFMTGVVMGSPIISVLAFSLASAVFYAEILREFAFIVKMPWRHMAIPLLIEAILAAVICLPLLGVGQNWGANSAANIGLFLVVSGAALAIQGARLLRVARRMAAA